MSSVRRWVAAPLLLLLGTGACSHAGRAPLPAAPAPPEAAEPAPPVLPRVLISTEVGAIEVELDPVHAPVTASNFLHYVDAGAYTDGFFHRTVTLENQPSDPVKIEVVQAGPDAGRFHDFPPIPLERTSETRLRHLDGTISMAREGPDTATSEFFICVGPQPDLDFGGGRQPDGQGFAAFGRVVSGLAVVRRIHGSVARGQTLTPPIRILDVRRVSGDEEGSPPPKP